MKIWNKKSLLTMAFLASTTSVMAGYEEAKKLLEMKPAPISQALLNAPSTYFFPSRFDGADSVTYDGQSFRQVLIEDLKSFMSSQKKGNYPGTSEQAFVAFWSYINFNNKSPISAPLSINGSSFFGVKAIGINQQAIEIEEGYLYDDLQNPGKKLLDKLAGNDNQLRRGKLFGWNDQIKTPQELLEKWGREFAHNVTEEDSFLVPNGNLAPQRIDSADTTIHGHNLSELVQKFLLGAVNYSQAAEDYLATHLGASKGMLADNELKYEGKQNHTALEHFIDEAYGYFGGARDFSLYNDTQLASGISFDTNSDGMISLLNEKNLGLSKNFGRVDRSAKDGQLDLSNEIISSLISARHLITTRPEDYRTYAIAYSEVALGAWEKTKAALGIIYINNLLRAYSLYGTENYNFKNLAKFWSELKGFTLGLQFNPKAIMSDKRFDQFHSLISDRPTLPHDEALKVEAYKRSLLEARKILQSTYGFSEMNVQNW